MSRRGFNHPLSSFALKEPISEQRAVELYHLIRAGNLNARIEMMRAHLRLGFTKVAFFCAKEISAVKRDELVSVMLESLWEGIDRLYSGSIVHHGDKPNPTAYLMMKLFGDLRAFSFVDRLLPTDPRTGYMNTVVQLSGDAKRPYVDPAQSLICVELKAIAVKSEQEAKILEMRLSGMNDVEIAEELHVTKARVGQIRHDMANRVKRYL